MIKNSFALKRWGVGCFVLLYLCLGAGCNIINPEETTPCYLELLPPVLIRDGKATPVNVPDVWVYQYPSYNGTFQPPTRLPINRLEDKLFLFRGGVWENGNPTFRTLYPFWRFDTLQISELTPGKTYTVQPKIRYYGDTVYVKPYQENFEGIQVKFAPYRQLGDTVLIQRTQVDAFEGISCGVARFDSTKVTMELVSSDYFTLPQDGRQIWLEVSYRSNINFAVSLLTNSSMGLDIPLPIIPGTPYQPDKWQTAFLNLTTMVNRTTAGAIFKLYLRAQSDGTDRFLYLDDIRLLYFK